MLRTLNQINYCRLTLFRRYANKSSKVSTLDYCADIVRQHDYENFLATLLVAKSIRSPALILRAFNVEVARVQDQTTDPKTAVFRLQFWQDALNVIYMKHDTQEKAIPANPVAQELYKVCKLYNLPKRQIEKLINSRKDILNNKYFKSLEDVEKYSEESVSSLYYLLLSLTKITNVNADHAASHLGKAQGITNILRSIYVSNHHKVVSLPMDILMKNNISQEMVLRGVDNADMRNVVFEIASRANSHLRKARSISVPDEAKQLFLPAVAIGSYLKKLEKMDFNVYDQSLQRGSTMLPFQLYFKRLFNRY